MLDTSTAPLLTDAILAIHLVIVVFNLFGLIVVPLGAWRGWTFVRGFWWRASHLAAMAVVAVQALMGRSCFLTLWQSRLLEQAGVDAYRQPLIVTWTNRLLYWHLPLWFFAALYTAAAVYVLGLWWWVPPSKPRLFTRSKR